MGVMPSSARGCIRRPFDGGKVYFFAGRRYWRYDLEKDCGEAHYPLPLGEWPLPGVFATGIDAVLDGFGPFAGKSYFFKGDKYVRYDWATNAIDVGPNPIQSWGLAGDTFGAGVDLAFNGQKSYTGKAYFFKGDRYLRYDWATDRIDGGPNQISAWNLGPGFEDGITACCNTATLLSAKSYFFKGDRYVRYDWDEDRADPGYPLPTGAGWPTGLAVWAEHKRAPLLVSADARLEAGANRVIAYPGGTPRGQAGWQLGVKFPNPAKLAETLEQATIPEFYGDDDAGSGTIPLGSITRLALNGHGIPGSLDIGTVALGPDRLSVFTMAEMRPVLERIGRMLEPAAPIVLLGCNCARGSEGDDLLEPLSQIWAGHEVSGFTTIGYADSGKQQRPSTPWNNPGMRVTDEKAVFSGDLAIEAREEDLHFGPLWNDLVKLPWGHEGLGPHRKTALNGQIVYFDADD